MADDYLTVAEVAEVLKCSPATIRRVIAAGKLSAVEVSERTTRIPLAEFARFTGREPAAAGRPA